MKFASKSIQHHPPHLRHVATLPWEIKNSNFLQMFSDTTRYGRKFKKLHIKCTDFNSSTCATVYACIYVFFKILSSSLNTMLIVDKHCSDVCSDEFPMRQIDRKSKQVKEQWHGKFYLQSVRQKLAILNTKNIKICGSITNAEATIMQLVCIFFHVCWLFAENLNFQFPKVV